MRRASGCGFASRIASGGFTSRAGRCVRGGSVRCLDAVKNQRELGPHFFGLLRVSECEGQELGVLAYRLQHGEMMILKEGGAAGGIKREPVLAEFVLGKPRIRTHFFNIPQVGKSADRNVQVGALGRLGQISEVLGIDRMQVDGDAADKDEVADTPEKAANLRLRSELMDKITALVDENRWTQADAARRSRVTQPRMNDLLRGRISRFSLDALVNIAASLGRHVHVELAVA